MQYSDEVKKLAETLKNSGLAASMKDALDRAQAMVGRKEEKEEVREEPVEKAIDTAQTTLGNIREEKEDIDESNESIETEAGLKKEEVFTNKPDKEQQPNKKRVNNPRQKKVDLTEVFNVNK